MTGLVPGNTYVVYESRVPDGYVLDPTPQTITVSNGTGNSWTSGGTGTGNGTGTDSGNGLTFENDPLSFYWRDTMPAAVRLDRVVTGTYNFPGTYKIVYKINNTGDYRTLADSLSTSRNYDLAASPTALGLASNERVTEIMFVFGQTPGGFSQVEAPMLYCTAVSSFVNVADVGGTYNGVWVQAVTRWVTTVYGKPTPLPRTGY